MSVSRAPEPRLTSVSQPVRLTNASEPPDKLTLVSPKLTLVSIFGSWLWQVPTGAHKSRFTFWDLPFEDFHKMKNAKVVF